jgi:hypothetical protein
MHWSQCWLLFRKFFVKVARIGAAVLCEKLSVDSTLTQNDDQTYDRREVRRWNALVHNIIEADILKEWVFLNFLSVSLP